MSTVYKQPRETVEARIYTKEYRFYGNIFLIPGRSTADMVNLEHREIVPMTDVKLYSPGYADPPGEDELQGRLPFLGINRAKIMWILGGRPGKLKQASPKELKVALLYPGYVLSGYLQVPGSARLTDHLQAGRYFQTIERVRLYPMAEGQALSEIRFKDRFDFVTVNVHSAVGVIES